MFLVTNFIKKTSENYFKILITFFNLSKFEHGNVNLW